MVMKRGGEMERRSKQQAAVEKPAEERLPVRLTLEELEVRAAPTPSIPIPPP